MNDGLNKYQEFFDIAYAGGAIDVKTKHLIALGASLGAGCEPWTEYCLAVARKNGATDEELDETMQIAMTVGATKIQIIQESSLAAMNQQGSEQNTEPEQAGDSGCEPWALTDRSGWAVRIESKPMKKVLMFLAQGFEDLEAVTIIDVLGWTHVREHLTPVSLTTCGFHDRVTGKFGTCITPDHNIKTKKLDYGKYDAFALPGGFHDSGFDEAYCEEIHAIAREIHKTKNSGVIVTMCVGISPIADAGMLNGKKATTYNLSRFHDNVARLEVGGAQYTGKPVEEDDNIISCAGPASSLEVALLLVEKLTGKENADAIKKLMIYSRK